MQLPGYYLVGILEMWWNGCMTAIDEAGGLDQMTSRSPFQPQTFCDPVNSAS